MSQTWSAITTNDVKNYLASNQVDAIDQQFLGTGQTDRLTGLIADAAEEVRGKIRSRKFTVVSATAGAVPPELKRTTCMLVVESLMVAIPTFTLTDGQKEHIRRAHETLKEVASGEFLVSLPSDPAAYDVQVAKTGPAVADERKFTRDTLAGL